MPMNRLGLGLGLQRGGGASAPPVVALSISGTPVLTATEDEAYAGFTATASGGAEPYTYSLVGTWPAGISIDTGSGAVSGTPTESGTFAGLSVRVTDANLDTADLDTFAIEVEAAAVPSIAFASHATSSNNASPTLAGMAIGEAAIDRLVFAFINFNGTSGTPSFGAVTIGGVTATPLLENSPASNDRWGLFVAAVPTGTTADVPVVVTGGTASTDVHVILLRATGISATPHQTNTGSAVATSVAATIDCPAGGIIIGGLENSGASEAMTWTNLAELDDYAAVATNSKQLTVAGNVVVAEQTDLSVTCAVTTPGANRVLRLMLASFAPL